MPAGTLFPTAHTEAIIAAAEAGKRFIALPIFDGTGDRGAQDSSIAIANWGPSPNPPYPALANMQAGRVRIAFFDRDPKPATKSDKPTGSPDYEVGKVVSGVTLPVVGDGVADAVAVIEEPTRDIPRSLQQHREATLFRVGPGEPLERRLREMLQHVLFECLVSPDLRGPALRQVRLACPE